MALCLGTLTATLGQLDIPVKEKATGTPGLPSLRWLSFLQLCPPSRSQQSSFFFDQGNCEQWLRRNSFLFCLEKDHTCQLKTRLRGGGKLQGSMKRRKDSLSPRKRIPRNSHLGCSMLKSSGTRRTRPSPHLPNLVEFIKPWRVCL